MKKKFLTVFSALMLISTWGYAQKGDNYFSFQGGYESFSRFPNDGYNFALNFKHYMNNRIYAVANFHAGLSNMERKGQIVSSSDRYYDLDNKQRDYMLGFGLGGDILRLNRHIVYAQATAGLGATDEKRENVEHSDLSVTTTKDNRTTFALSFSAGYDYQLTDWFTIGVNYTGYQLDYYKNSCNLKLGVRF